MNADLISVLLVDDDPGDVLLVREAFEDHKIGNLLSVVSDGVEAIQYVRGEGEYVDATRPDLILLDLNLPRKSGIEVLAEIKQDPQLALIPVVVLTTSEAEEDIVGAYKLHANAYITKPVDFEQFTQIVHQIDDFFVGLVKLPRSMTAPGARAERAPPTR
jgi:CheY-like chemotaxis protein